VSVLVTGGAGYIGSHVARMLKDAGESVVVVDDLSTGLEHRILGLPFLELDLASGTATDKLESFMADEGVDSVIHFAALKQVADSVAEPEKYFTKNLGGHAKLLTAMRNSGVYKLVFSSSCATYGIPEGHRLAEKEPTRPINPYGQTKLICEWMNANSESAWGLRYVNLRYFNVAGAGWPDLADTQLQNLIPIVFAAIELGTKPKVYGNDYGTDDGSCIRDYVHVLDLALGHMRALDYLDQEGRPFNTFNVGTGKGFSVLEVIEQIRSTTGIDFEIEIAPRRAGDPARLIADPSRIEKVMGWKAKKSLTEIVESAWQAFI